MKNHWLDVAEYPFRHHYFDVNGHKMHYIDEGSGEILLFVHGTPSWSFDFRNVVKALSPQYRCIAVDHIGFGLSDKPERYDYSTLNHARTLEQFIVENQLESFTLVVHDFGGPIGFEAAMRHPERIERMVVLNSWLWSSANDPDFIKFSKLLKSPLLPFLYRRLNFSPRFILPDAFGDKKISKRLLRQYTKPFADKTQRNGALAFARSLLHDQDWFESLWNQRHAIADKPMLFVWGMKDPVVKPHFLEKFESGFPHAQTVRLGTCGHFPQEEEPEEVANAVRGFLEAVPSRLLPAFAPAPSKRGLY